MRSYLSHIFILFSFLCCAWWSNESMVSFGWRVERRKRDQSWPKAQSIDPTFRFTEEICPPYNGSLTLLCLRYLRLSNTLFCQGGSYHGNYWIAIRPPELSWSMAKPSWILVQQEINEFWHVVVWLWLQFKLNWMQIVWLSAMGSSSSLSLSLLIKKSFRRRLSKSILHLSVMTSNPEQSTITWHAQSIEVQEASTATCALLRLNWTHKTVF